MPTLATCRTEVEGLHRFFVRWFTGRADDEDFDRVDRALADDFEMVTPAGVRRTRRSILSGIDDSYAQFGPAEFSIEIRNVELIERMDPVALVRYEEWQDGPEESTGRISSALFREDSRSPNSIEWRHLHETWIED